MAGGCIVTDIVAAGCGCCLVLPAVAGGEVVVTGLSGCTGPPQPVSSTQNKILIYRAGWRRKTYTLQLTVLYNDEFLIK